MAGVDRDTRLPIGGWAEVERSVRTILTTPRGSRLMRREFGCDLVRLLDAPMNEATIVDAIVAIVDALRPRVVNGNQYGEPRVDVVNVSIFEARAGHLGVDLVMLYYPRGHLGDFSRVELRGTQVLVGDG